MTPLKSSQPLGISRRSLLKGAGIAAAAGATASILGPSTPPAQAQGPDEFAVYLPCITGSELTPLSPSEVPPLEVIALNRMAYGPRPGDIERLQTMGFESYVEEQLNPTAEDPDVDAKLAATRLEINGEQRPLSSLTMSLAELWAVNKNEDYAERVHPAEQVRAAAWLRAIYSQWQLREVLVEFWHNHFHVNVRSYPQVAATFPLYDRLMRQHCLGNFRTFLEEIARSVAMQYYLNNVVSKGTPPNENYARELFELHTLGSDNYLNHLYDDWRSVPGAEDSPPLPLGYIDEDVYEAARAFTGWTIANGAYIDGGGTLPDTGEFYYFNDWHDRFQKRVLATEIRRDQAPELDGKTVLDLLAQHPGTARHLCTRLCRRLVDDNPPEELIQAATETWLANLTAADQIKQTVRTILLSEQFRTTWGQKVKNPFELAISFLRAIDADCAYTNRLNWRFQQTGYQHFFWPTPTGHPDTQEHWLSTNIMVQRWTLLQGLLTPYLGAATVDFEAQMPPDIQTSRQIVDYWIGRLLQRSVAEPTRSALLDFMCQSIGDNEPPTDPDEPPDGRNSDQEWERTDYRTRLENLVLLIARIPEFQMR